MTTEQIYFALLRKAIWGDKGNVNVNENANVNFSGCNIEDLFQLCMRQGTAALVFNQLLMLNAECRMLNDECRMMNDECRMQNAECRMLNDVAMQMKQVCMQNMLSYERHIQLLRTTWQALTENHIHPVLLKGFGLARLYPLPYLRNWGDLDVYVGPDQYHQAAAVLRETFPNAKHHEEEWEELKHYNFQLPNGLVEMHRSAVKMFHPRDKRVFEALEKEGMKGDWANGERRKVKGDWANGERRKVKGEGLKVEGVEIQLPEEKFNLLFTFLHAWIHFVEEGLGYKQICDVALLAHWTDERLKANGEWRKANNYLKKNLRRLKLWQPWQLMGYVMVHTLGLPEDEWPLYNENRWLKIHGERFLEQIMAVGLCPPKDYHDCTWQEHRDRNREKAMKMNPIARRWKTFRSRFNNAMEIRPYSPQYARHMVMTTLLNGIIRFIKGQNMEVHY